MKKELLTVKELAAKLRMTLKSIQRAYRKVEIPVEWLGRMARFNLAKADGQWNLTDEAACSVSTGQRQCRVRSPAKAGSAPRNQPPVGNTGALPTGIVTGGPWIP